DDPECAVSDEACRDGDPQNPVQCDGRSALASEPNVSVEGRAPLCHHRPSLAAIRVPERTSIETMGCDQVEPARWSTALFSTTSEPRRPSRPVRVSRRDLTPGVAAPARDVSYRATAQSRHRGQPVTIGWLAEWRSADTTAPVRPARGGASMA